MWDGAKFESFLSAAAAAATAFSLGRLLGVRND